MSIKTLPLYRGLRRTLFPDGPFELNKNSLQANGLVAWWPTIASRGGNVMMDLARRHNAAFNGGLTWTIDPNAGNILDYNGSSGYLSFSRTGDIPTSSEAFTLSVWIEDNTTVDNLGTYHRIISYYDESQNIQLGLGRTETSGDRCFYIYNLSGGGGDPSEVTMGDVPLILNHVIATFDGSNVYKIYLNGFDKGGGSMVTGVGGFTANSTTVYIGQRGNGAYVDGTIGDVRFYNRALSDAEVWQLYDQATRWELYQPVQPKFIVTIPVAGGPTTETVSHILAATLRKTQTVDHILTATLQETRAEIHVLTSTLEKTQTASHVLTAQLSGVSTVTHILTSTLKKTQTVTHVLTSTLQKTDTATHVLTTELTQTRTATHILASILEKTQTTTHVLTAELSQAGVVQYLLTATLSQTQTATHILAATLSQTQMATYVLTTQLSGATTVNHVLVATLSQTQTATHTLAATLQETRTATHILTATLGMAQLTHVLTATLISLEVPGRVELAGSLVLTTILSGRFETGKALAGQFEGAIDLRGEK